MAISELLSSAAATMLPSHQVARILSVSYSLSKRIVAGSRSYKLERFDSSGRVKSPKTLQYRFVKYLLDEASANSADANSRTHRSIFLPPASIEDENREIGSIPRNLTTRVRLASIVAQIEGLKKIDDLAETTVRLEPIDKEAIRVLEQLSLDDIITVLNKLVEVVPYKILGLRVYSKSFEIARRMIQQSPTPPSSKIVNLLFLVSLKKTAAAKDIRFFLKHLRTDFKDLSIMEQCIVSISTFKAGVKLNKKSILAIEDILINDPDALIKEPGLFVSLIKALRQGGPTPEFSLTRMSEKLLKVGERFEISTAVPVLGLYAEILNAEKHVVRRLIDDSIEDLSRKNSAEVRIKDVDRLLWATTRLNCQLSHQQLDEVEKFVDHRTMMYSNNPKMFVNTILCLWILRSAKCRQRVEYCFREKIFQPLLKSPESERLRLNLLMECVRIEAPGMEIPQEFDEAIEEKPYKSSKELETVCELIKCLGEHLGIEEIRIDCPVKMLRIYGITARHRSLGRIHVDLLNNVTCLKDTWKPNGLMSLKLRLLRPLGYWSIVLKNDDADGLESLIWDMEERIKSTLGKRESEAELRPRFSTDVGEK